MSETRKITASRTLPRHLLVDSGQAAGSVALQEALAELREIAVVANGEGWQSGPIEHFVAENGVSGETSVTVCMVLTR